MEASLVIVGMGIAAAIAAAISWSRSGGEAVPKDEAPPAATPEEWRRAADALGLSRLAAGHSSIPGLIGRQEGFRTTVLPAKGGRRASIVVTVHCGAAMSGDVVVRAARSGSGEPARAGRLLTGDEAFDAAVVVTGSAASAAALLGDSERAAIVEHLARTDAGIAGGRVMETLAASAASPAGVEAAVRRCTALARRLTSRGGHPGLRVAKSAASDPVAAVRAACMELIVRQPRLLRLNRRRHVLRAGLADPQPSVRLAAALGLRHEAQDVLLEIASAAASPADLRARAIGGLAAASAPLVSAWLADADAAVRLAALRLVLRTEMADVAAVVADLPDAAQDAEAAIRFELLARFVDGGDDRVEHALGRLLADAEPARQLRGIAALRAAGTPRSAAALRRLSGTTRDARVQSAAREALESILRLSGAQAGTLTLAAVGPSATGALSADPAGDGRLSAPRAATMREEDALS